jgi:hypothetical protein
MKELLGLLASLLSILLASDSDWRSHGATIIVVSCIDREADRKVNWRVYGRPTLFHGSCGRVHRKSDRASNRRPGNWGQ